MSKAIVVGGGIAGMCAARVLADAFDEVTLIERDHYPDTAASRRGVPQGRMFHTMLERGRREIETLFPGIHKLMDERHAPRISFGFNCALMTPRGWGRNLPFPSITSLFCTRGFLETAIRDLFRQEERVTVIEDTTVAGLTSDGARVCTGVIYKTRGDESEHRMSADLVVDASGASSRAATWLSKVGVTPPHEHELDPLLTYAGVLLKRKPGTRFPKHWWWTHGAFVQRVPPRDNKGAHLIRQEGDLWLLTLVAGDGIDLPEDVDGIADFLAQMRSPLVYDMYPYFEPAGAYSRFRLPKNRWKFYEDWSDPLDGFIAIGAATCVFNPNMGQGMSVATADAGILRGCLDQTTSPRELPRLFFREQARFQKNAYQLACRNDLRFDSVQGKRSLRVRLFNAYRDMITQAIAANPALARPTGRVDMLLDPISRLYRPGYMLRVLFAWAFLRSRQTPDAAARVAPEPPPRA